MYLKGCKLYIVNADLFGGYAYSYILETKHNVFIIDCGIESSKKAFDDILENINNKPISLLITHGHWDHVGLANYLKNKYRASIYANKQSEKMMSDKQYQADTLYDKYTPKYSFKDNIIKLWEKEFIDATKPDMYIEDGDEFKDDDFTLRVLKTPGHSDDQLSFYNEENNIIFTGDTLQGRGYNNHPALYENKDELINSIKLIKNINPKTIFGGHFFVSEPDSCRRYIEESIKFVYEVDEFVKNNNVDFDELLKLFIKQYQYEYSVHSVITLHAHKKKNS